MTIEEMRAELEAAEWRFVVADTNSYFVDVTMPNGFNMIYHADFETTPEHCLSNAVGDAYPYLQKERQFEAMKAELEQLRNENAQYAEFVKQVADAGVPSEWYTPVPYKYAFHRLKNNARALIVKLNKSSQEISR